MRHLFMPVEILLIRNGIGVVLKIIIVRQSISAVVDHNRVRKKTKKWLFVQ